MERTHVLSDQRFSDVTVRDNHVQDPSGNVVILAETLGAQIGSMGSLGALRMLFAQPYNANSRGHQVVSRKQFVEVLAVHPGNARGSGQIVVGSLHEILQEGAFKLLNDLALCLCKWQPLEA